MKCILLHDTFPSATVFSFYIFTFLMFRKINKSQSQAHGAWISFPPPPFFQNFHNHSFFKIFIMIRFSSFDNISRRHTSWIIRVFCVHSFSTNTCILCPQVFDWKTVDTEYTYYSTSTRIPDLPFSSFGSSRDYGMDLCLEVYLWTIYPYFTTFRVTTLSFY